MTHNHATNIAQTHGGPRRRGAGDSRPSGPVGDLRGEYAPRLMGRRHGASRESPPRLTAETHGVSRAVSRRLTRRESATTTRRVIVHCDTLLSGCYRCFDHHSIQVHSTALCHDCPMIVACCTNACHCVAAAVAIIR